MELLSQIGTHLRHILLHGRWFTTSVVILFAGLEMFGRQAGNDLHDAIGGAVFVGILACIGIRHRHHPIGWVKKLGYAVWYCSTLGERLKFDIGPDLRGEPYLRKGIPLVTYALVALFVGWIALAQLTWWAWPEGFRSAFIQVTYLGYLTGLIFLWGLLFVAILGGVYLPVVLIQRIIPKDRLSGEPHLSRRQLFLVALYLVTTICASYMLPSWPMFCVCGVAVLVAWVWKTVSPHTPERLSFIWRSRRGGDVRSVSLPQATFILVTLLSLLLVALVATTTGGGLFPTSTENNLPMTKMMGNWVAWLIPGFFLSLAIFAVMSRRHNPAIPVLPVLNLANPLKMPATPLRQLSRAHGWELNLSTPERTHVSAVIVEPNKSQATEFDPNWPLNVSVDDLEGNLVWDRFSRRAEIQYRRLITKGIERLFRDVKDRRYSAGHGYWFAPHLWFVTGMTRDEVTTDGEPGFFSEIVGTPFRELFNIATRHYLYNLLRNAQIDLIFVEDGVNFRNVVRVFRRLFELADKQPGRRAEDVHFSGLTKVKVMFHDLDIDEPFTSETYPEPKFHPLARVRVMHLFKDRGDQEEPLETPFDFDYSPTPIYAN